MTNFVFKCPGVGVALAQSPHVKVLNLKMCVNLDESVFPAIAKHLKDNLVSKTQHVFVLSFSERFLIETLPF